MLNKIVFSAFFFIAIPLINSISFAQQLQTDTDWGLHTTTLETEHGNIKVHLPDDISSGDTLSGTVVAEPAGTTVAERQKNTDTLSGYVVEVEGKKTDIGKKILKVSIPAVAAAGGGVTAVLFKDGKGNTIAKSNLPVSPSPSYTGVTDFNLPEIGQAGRPLQVTGPFDGDLSTTSISIEGSGIEKLAESPRKTVAASPIDIFGPVDLEITEGGKTVSGTMNNLKISLSADKLKLQKGETTKLKVNVQGLQGIDEPVNIKLTNMTPQIVSMGGSDVQIVTINPNDVSQTGSYYIESTLTGIQTGGFDIVAQAQDEDCKQVVVEERIEWGDWMRDGSRRYRKGTIYKVEKCVDPGGPHPEKKTELGKALEETSYKVKYITKDIPHTDGSRTVTKEKRLRDNDKYLGEKTADYDKDGNLRTVTEKNSKGKITEEWKKEGDDWYKKRGNEWAKRGNGPRDIPERIN